MLVGLYISEDIPKSNFLKSIYFEAIKILKVINPWLQLKSTRLKQPQRIIFNY